MTTKSNSNKDYTVESDRDSIGTTIDTFRVDERSVEDSGGQEYSELYHIETKTQQNE